MPTILSTFATHQANTNHAARKGDVSANEFYVDLKATDLVAGNLIDLGILPAGQTIVDATLIPDDLDTGTAITLDVGLMSGIIGDKDSVRTVGTELFAATTAAQTGAVTRVSAKSAFTIPAMGRNRSIGVRIATAPTGATAGRLRLLVLSTPVDDGFQF